MIAAGDPQGALALLQPRCGPECSDARLLHAAGLAWMQSGHGSQAMSCLQRAIELDGRNQKWWLDLAVVTAALELWPQTVQRFDAAAELGPLPVRVWRLQARALRLAGEYGRSIEVLEELLRLKPGDTQSRAEVARLYTLCGFHHDALRHCRVVAAAHPDDSAALMALSRAGIQVGATTEAIAAARAVMQLTSDIQFESEYLVMLLHEESQTAETIREEHENWARRHGSDRAGVRHWPNPPDPERKLHVGYVCGEGTGAPSYYFLLPLLTMRSRDQFHVVWYHTSRSQGSRTRRYASEVDCWRDVSELKEEEILEQIRRDRIDVLVDVSGQYEGKQLRIFATGAAPVQASFPNYPSTTGVTGIQYIVTDEYVCPFGADSQYVETPVHVAPGYLAYAVPDAPPLTPGPASGGEPITFGMFQRPAKAPGRYWDAVAEIMNRCSRSNLVVHYASRELDAEDSLACGAVRELLKKRGVDANRVRFAGRRSALDHLSVIARSDIALDTFPYNGQTTTCECLLMGVPVVTLYGEYHVARVGLSILSRLDCGGLCAKDVNEYVEIAIRLAHDREQLEQYRTNLRERLTHSSLVSDSSVRSVEDAYRAMWRRWCAQREDKRRKYASE